MKMYSLYDTKSEVWCRPVYAHADGEILRIYSDIINDRVSDGVLNVHPEDFDLFYIGYFNEFTGEIVTPKSPEHITKLIYLRGELNVSLSDTSVRQETPEEAAEEDVKEDTEKDALISAFRTARAQN